MTDTAASSILPGEAEELLESVVRSREAAERRAGAYWFAPVVIGVLLFISSWFITVWDGGGVTVYWLVVAPLAYAAIRRYERIQLGLSGAVSRGPSHQLVIGAFIVGCVVSGAIGGATGEPAVMEYGPLLAMVAALLVSGWRRRSRRYAVLAVALVAFIVFFALRRDSFEYPSAVLFAVVIGANLVIEGFTERNRRGA